MIPVQHLEHGRHSIWCKLCGHAFATPSKVLDDPFRVLSMKESLAARHRCSSARTPRPETIQVWRAPVTTGELDRYWNNAVRATRLKHQWSLPLSHEGAAAASR